MKGTKENTIPSGRLRISDHRCLCKPCSQESQFKIYFHKCFSPTTVNLEKGGTRGEIFLLLCYFNALQTESWGDRHGRILTFCWSVVSYPISQLQSPGRVECLGHCPINNTRNLYRRAVCFILLFLVFGWSSAIKYRLTREKGTSIH